MNWRPNNVTINIEGAQRSDTRTRRSEPILHRSTPEGKTALKTWDNSTKQSDPKVTANTEALELALTKHRSADYKHSCSTPQLLNYSTTQLSIYLTCVISATNIAINTRNLSITSLNLRRVLPILNCQTSTTFKLLKPLFHYFWTLLRRGQSYFPI
jgi:hypothetical protein